MVSANIAPLHQPDTMPGVLLYSRIRKSPYFYASRKHGVQKYSVYNHTYHPRHYGDPVEEYWQLLNGVTLWDVGVERQIEITGPDAFTFTNWLVTRDLTKCKVGQCKYVFLTAPDGGIVNDPVLLRLGEQHFWLSIADSDVLLWTRALAHGHGFDVTIREADVGPIQVQGPKSGAVMADLFGQSILDVPYYYLVERELDGMQVVVSRTGYTAELGYEIYLHNASHEAERLWNLVWEAGQPHGMTVIGPCHLRRIEGGILSYGADITLATNPFEVGMGYQWMVDLRGESDFIGRAALERIKTEGVSRKLVGVELDGEPLGAYNDGTMIDFFPVEDPVFGVQIGHVTSACYSPRLAKNIGYAMVPVDYSELDTELVITTPQERVQALVVPKPFIDPKKEIPKAQPVEPSRPVLVEYADE